MLPLGKPQALRVFILHPLNMSILHPLNMSILNPIANKKEAFSTKKPMAKRHNIEKMKVRSFTMPWPLSGCSICLRAHRSVMMARHRRIGCGKWRRLKCSLGRGRDPKVLHEGVGRLNSFATNMANLQKTFGG